MFADAAIHELHQLLPVRLTDLFEQVDKPRGTCLFKAGEKPSHMFFVVRGEVILERPGLQGASVILQRTRRGFVSEASLKSPKYHCDGQVVANATIIQIPVRDVTAAMDEDPAFAGRWIAMLNRELRRLRLQCERLSLTTVQARLAHLLETEGENGRFPIGAGIKSIAAELGVTHEALYRCIYSMERQGRLQRADQYLWLLPGGAAR
ncbi:MAG: Crp/Fnr family transcriptional regulator [Burkholderiaceae bacterium]|nr:Crp/Fnr family transcriptional regulator [Burkholderiaceae bacterium]